MKNSGAIRHKLKQVAFRHLKRRLETELRPHPDNCTFNHEVRHPKVIAEGGPPLGVCLCQAMTSADRVCDVAWGGVERAQKCRFFKSAATKDFIKENFREFLSTAQLHEIAAEYPDLAALMWVLEDDAPNREVEIVEEDDFQEVETDEEAIPAVTFDIGGVPVQVADAIALERLQQYLASQEEQIAEATEAADGHREFAEASLRDKETAERALHEMEQEVIALQARAEALEQQAASAESESNLLALAVPQGFWARLRWLLGGAA